MHHNIRSGTLNGNQSSPHQAGNQPVSSREALAGSVVNASEVGAGFANATGICPCPIKGNPGRRQGGQYAIGLFGVRGVEPATEAPAPAKAAPEVKAPSSRPQPQGARVVNGQTYSQRRRRYSGAIMAGAIAARQASHAATVTVPAAGVALPMPKSWEPADAHAMRQAAAAADERERHPAPDLEEWDRTLPFGYTEVLLAQD